MAGIRTFFLGGLLLMAALVVYAADVVIDASLPAKTHLVASDANTIKNDTPAEFKTIFLDCNDATTTECKNFGTFMPLFNGPDKTAYADETAPMCNTDWLSLRKATLSWEDSVTQGIAEAEGGKQYFLIGDVYDKDGGGDEKKIFCGGVDDAAPTPPIDGSGGSTPPSEGSGAATPPSEGSGAATPPPGSGGSTPPIDGSGGSTPPIDGSGGSTPPIDGSGGSTPPTNGSGGSTPPAPTNKHINKDSTDPVFLSVVSLDAVDVTVTDCPDMYLDCSAMTADKKCTNYDDFVTLFKNKQFTSDSKGFQCTPDIYTNRNETRGTLKQSMDDVVAEGLAVKNNGFYYYLLLEAECGKKIVPAWCGGVDAAPSGSFRGSAALGWAALLMVVVLQGMQSFME